MRSAHSVSVISRDGVVLGTRNLSDTDKMHGIVVIQAIESGTVSRYVVRDEVGTLLSAGRLRFDNDVVVKGGDILLPESALDFRILTADELRALRNRLVHAARPAHDLFPRAWELLGYMFSSKTRIEIYDPSYQELLSDYYATRQKFPSPWARRWLAFCFTVRTIQLVIQCSSVAWKGAILGMLVTMGPKWLAELIRAIFKDW